MSKQTESTSECAQEELAPLWARLLVDILIIALLIGPAWVAYLIWG